MSPTNLGILGQFATELKSHAVMALAITKLYMKWTHKSPDVATTLNSLLYFFQRVCHFSECVLRETNRLINL